jgi:hypothetical protein
MAPQDPADYTGLPVPLRYLKSALPGIIAKAEAPNLNQALVSLEGVLAGWTNSSFYSNSSLNGALNVEHRKLRAALDAIGNQRR